MLVADYYRSPVTIIRLVERYHPNLAYHLNSQVAVYDWLSS